MAAKDRITVVAGRRPDPALSRPMPVLISVPGVTQIEKMPSVRMIADHVDTLPRPEPPQSAMSPPRFAGRSSAGLCARSER